MQKLLTIAVPTYNREKYIRIALNSLISQYDERVEILVSDNCSEDDTESVVINGYPLVRYEKNKYNMGADGNFLECYKKANGKYTLLLGDDDVLIDGAIREILNFITFNSDLSLLFLNHTSFCGEYKGIEYCKKPFVNSDVKSFVTSDKNRFLRVAKHQLSFMSSFIVKTDIVNSIQDPEKYSNTSFIHMCLAFEATRNGDSMLGYLDKICIAQNMTENKSNINAEWIFKVFGEKEKYALCNVGADCGYDERLLNKCYCDFICSSWPVMILSFKAKRVTNWRKSFWKYGYSAIKEYKKARWMILSAVFFPSFLAKILRNIKYIGRKNE
jgi:glycosyltransferase involved in cell wall biosynthesis